jgi:cytochrome b561
MTVENYLAEAGALATLAGILAGFAISAVIQLLSSASESKIATATIVTYAAATVMFLYSLIVFILVFAATAEQNQVITSMDTQGSIAVLVMYGAVFVFLAAIGLTGWIRSRITGILTSSFAVITMCLIAIAIVSISSAIG